MFHIQSKYYSNTATAKFVGFTRYSYWEIRQYLCTACVLTALYHNINFFFSILQAFGIGTHLRNKRKKRNEKWTTSRPLAMHRLTRVPTYRYMVGLMLLPLPLLVLFMFYVFYRRMTAKCVCVSVLLFSSSSSFVYYHLAWNFSMKYLYSISFTLTHRWLRPMETY